MTEFDALFAGEAEPEAKPWDRPWLITFCDLFCLLLAFFVLLFSMSAVETSKWRAMKQAFSKHQESAFESGAENGGSQRPMGGVKPEPGLDLGYLGAVFEAHAKHNLLLQNAVIYRVGEKLVLSLPADLLFAPASATLEARGGTALFDLAGLLRNIANEITVVGHSDPTPVTNAFASNWDLSLTRAAAVAGALNRAGYARDIGAFGVADSHFKELPENLPWQHRLELARRVDIVVTPSQGAP